MNILSDRERIIFNAALELSGAARESFLAAQCGGDEALRSRIQVLLRAHDEAGSFLEEPALPAQTVVLPASEKPGDRIGRYKLLQQIGEGGCGVVYMAEQEEPVRRRVALKVIKLGMDTKQVIARFEAERQALAMMDHPNIAKVLDAGASETGRPYFVMELVRGVKITDYCDQNSLSTRERMDLFIKVCQAIQHAHQKGIIHRDIKPSNILVTINDGVAVPKVIDFGIAKATQGRLTDRTLFTAIEQFIGTPAYMSPEQAVLTSLDVDTRSDIYSLGVLLYELLTGRTPFDAGALLEAGWEEMRRTIRDQEPARPSTRLSTMEAGELTAAAKQRGSEPPKLVHLVRGDLDWIVMKCLEKDRNRRYETANGLAQDVERHLKNEVIAARPPGKFYQFQKLMRRNKFTFIAVGAVTAALVLGVIISSWQAGRATWAEKEQSRLRTDAEIARASEAKERTTAEEQLYDSLLAQARTLRNSQREGYRDAVFALLKQANALNVPQKNPIDLRREAAACLGDFIGLTPITFANFPANTEIEQMRLSPTGKMAAFSLSDGTILLRQLPSGTEIARLRIGDNIRSFFFSASGDQIIALQTPRHLDVYNEDASQIHLWTAGADGQWSQTESFPLPGAFQCLSSANGLFVATRKPWQIIDANTRKIIQTIEYAEPIDINERPLLAMSPDGKYLAEFQRGGIVLWDLNSHQRVKTFDTRNMVRVLQFSPDGKELAAFLDRGCDIYTMENFRKVNGFEGFIPRRVSQVAFASGQTVIALPLLQHNRLRLWDWEKNKDAAILEEAEGSCEAAFAPDDSFLLTCDERQARFHWLGPTSEKLTLPTKASAVNSAAFSPDGVRIASVASGRTLRMSDATTGQKIWEATLGGSSPVVAYSQDGRLLATACYPQKRIQFWDAATGKLLLDLGTNQVERAPFLMQFTSDGRRLVAENYLQGWSYEKFPKIGANIDVWTVAEGGIDAKLVKGHGPELDVDAYPYFSLAPDDHHVACFAAGERIYLCNLDGASPPLLMDIHVETDTTPYAQYVAFTPDSRQLFVMDTNRDIVTLDVTTGQKVSSFPTVYSGKPTSLELGPDRNISLSPDGAKLAVDSLYGRAIDIYDPKKGRLLYSLPEQNAQVKWVTWSPNSQRLALSLDNGELTIWNMAEVEQVLAKLELSP